MEEAWQGAGSDDVPVYRYGPGFKEDSEGKKLKITVISCRPHAVAQ